VFHGGTLHIVDVALVVSLNVYVRPLPPPLYVANIKGGRSGGRRLFAGGPCLRAPSRYQEHTWHLANPSRSTVRLEMLFNVGVWSTLGSHPCPTRQTPLGQTWRDLDSLRGFATNDGLHVCAGCILDSILLRGGGGYISTLQQLALVSSLVQDIPPSGTDWFLLSVAIQTSET
jgi:hypothetical protein